MLPGVRLPDVELDRIARICLAYGVDGLRADIVVARAALTLAAWQGRDEVTPDDIRDAARLALPHRRRRDPLDPPGSDSSKLEEALREPDEEPDGPDDGGPTGSRPSGEGDGTDQPVAAPGQAYQPRVLALPKAGERAHTGRRSQAYARRGRVVGARLPRGPAPRTCRPRCGPPPRGAAARSTRATCASPSTSDWRRTWCSSWWTPPGRWPPASGWAR
ncbi:hypothetical protein Prum_017980 [Phytohabitans rumicis]|uniref:ChlI/MoxR AAA lid domain-containing protein n=1 Tax=Phytohabitans rumicis TaxID=1076125 RepID=A0A6V8L223_9ACTN|nr:hypothetical protein Prum_017980 [Phytohabitans rumicis]